MLEGRLLRTRTRHAAADSSTRWSRPDALEAHALAFAAKLGAHPSAAYGYQKYKLQAEANQWIHAPADAGTDRFRAALADPAAFARLLGPRAGVAAGERFAGRPAGRLDARWLTRPRPFRSG
jgi:hypothetical protein